MSGIVLFEALRVYKQYQQVRIKLRRLTKYAKHRNDNPEPRDKLSKEKCNLKVQLQKLVVQLSENELMFFESKLEEIYLDVWQLKIRG